MKWLSDIIKGFFMGIANIIPGFSGGTMAIIMKIYDRFIYDLSDITKHPIKAIKDLFFIGVGLVIGMVFAMFTIALLLKKFPFPTIMLFVGLIIGSLPELFVESVKDNKTKLNMLFLIPTLAFMILIPFLNLKEAQLEISFKALSLIFIMGIISSVAMVIPGISGSFTLMAFGYYALILNTGTGFIKGFIKGDNVLDEFITMFVFTVACIIGILTISKIMELLLKKYKNAVYFAIIGFILGSPFTIIWSMCHNDDYNINYKSAGMWVATVICTIIGILVPILFKKLEQKISSKNVVEETKAIEDGTKIDE